MGRGPLPLREAVSAASNGALQARRRALHWGLRLGAQGAAAAFVGCAGLLNAQEAPRGPEATPRLPDATPRPPEGGPQANQRPSEGGLQQRQFSGRALHAETGQWLYTELHQQQLRGGRWVAGTIRYVSPQGLLLGEKKLDFGKDRFVPLMRTVYPTLGEEEAIVQVGEATVTMETSNKAGQRKTREVARVAGLAVDSGFHVFLQDRLEELATGRTVQMQLGVISQFDHFRFRIRRAEATQGSVLRLVVEPDSMLRLLVPPVKLAYDLRSRDMLEYEGLSNLVDPQTRKAPVVRITYDYAG